MMNVGRRIHSLAPCLIALLALAGCPASEEREESDAGRIEQLEAEIIEALCDSLAECCSHQSYPFDRGQCEILAAQKIARVVRVEERDQVDEAQAEICKAAIRRDVSGCEDIPIFTSCSGVLRGSLQQGEKCSQSYECAPVDGGSAYCQNVCRSGYTSKLGERCDDCESGPCADVDPDSPTLETYDCDRELVCRAGTCAARSTAGEPCSKANECGGSSRCDAAHNRCIAPTAIGEGCDGRAFCVDGAYCDLDYVCQSLKAEGVECDSDRECHGGICDGDACVGGTPVSLWSEQQCSGAKPF